MRCFCCALPPVGGTLGHTALRPPCSTYCLPFAASILQITFSYVPETDRFPHCLPHLRGGSPYKHEKKFRPVNVPLISTYCKHKRNFFRAKGVRHFWQTAQTASTMKLLRILRSPALLGTVEQSTLVNILRWPAKKEGHSGRSSICYLKNRCSFDGRAAIYGQGFNEAGKGEMWQKEMLNEIVLFKNNAGHLLFCNSI